MCEKCSEGTEGARSCGLARAVSQLGPTFDKAKSKTFRIFKETIKKNVVVVVHLCSTARPLPATISQPGGGSLSENEALAERD